MLRRSGEELPSVRLRQMAVFERSATTNVSIHRWLRTMIQSCQGWLKFRFEEILGVFCVVDQRKIRVIVCR